MHLCANVLWQGLLPAGTLVRRNFSFHPGEKSRWNEVETHPVDAREFAFLAGGEVFRWAEGISLGPPSAVVQNAHGGRQEPPLPSV
jgi:hypothetical protein